MNCRISYPLGTAHGEIGYLIIDTRTNVIGHALITGTLGIPEVERRLREAIRPVVESIAWDIKRAREKGANIE